MRDYFIGNPWMPAFSIAPARIPNHAFLMAGIFDDSAAPVERAEYSVRKFKDLLDGFQGRSAYLRRIAKGKPRRGLRHRGGK